MTSWLTHHSKGKVDPRGGVYSVQMTCPVLGVVSEVSYSIVCNDEGKTQNLQIMHMKGFRQNYITRNIKVVDKTKPYKMCSGTIYKTRKKSVINGGGGGEKAAGRPITQAASASQSVTIYIPR